MAYAKNPPNKIDLAGEFFIDSNSDCNCGVAATPGMLAEMYDNSGVNAYRPHASADEAFTLAVFLSSPESNLGIDSVIAVGETPKVGFMYPGCIFYGIVPSGQNISNAEFLQSNGDGKLKASAATTAAGGRARLQSLDNLGLVAADTRCRVQVIS